jgi:hypothetical protein
VFTCNPGLNRPRHKKLEEGKKLEEKQVKSTLSSISNHAQNTLHDLKTDLPSLKQNCMHVLWYLQLKSHCKGSLTASQITKDMTDLHHKDSLQMPTHSHKVGKVKLLYTIIIGTFS